MPTTVESLAEWVARHSKGGPVVFDPESRHQLYPDGASRNEFGTSEPPMDEANLLRAKHRYVELRTREEEDAFRSARADYISQTSYAASGAVPIPSSVAVDELRKGKARVEKWRKKLAALAEQVAELPEEKAARRREEMRREHEQRAHQLIGELQAITIDGDDGDDVDEEQ